MRTVPVPTTRRALLLAITTIVALAMTAVLAGCGTNTTRTPDAPSSRRPTPEATSDDVAPGSLIMIIRHGEKPDGANPGVDANGEKDDSSLTETGWDRAHRLADLFDPAEAHPRPGLARPKTVYAAGANDEGEGQRTRETVQPLADHLGIPVNTSFGKGDEEALVEHVISQPWPTLISWQHGEIPAIAQAFPSVTPTPPAEWPDDRFDLIWTLTKTDDGWHFTQLPELVLPQDQASVIED
jgi:broad specificity phosphatase PhoE